MKCTYYIILIVTAFVSICALHTKEIYDCRLCCSGQNSSDDNVARLTTFRNQTEISNCIKNCLADDLGTRNISGVGQWLCKDHNKTEIHFEGNTTKTTTDKILNCSYLLDKKRATNDFVRVATFADATFHKEDNKTTDNYYVNITWQPFNITDRSKKWTHYFVLWVTGDHEPPSDCQLVAKNQNFCVIDSTKYHYPDAIEFNVLTYPLMRGYGVNVKYGARPKQPMIDMFRIPLPTPAVTVVTSSFMAAIIVGCCVGIAFFVAVAIAWKLNLRVHTFQDIYRLYWETIGSGTQGHVKRTISQQTIIEDRRQVYLSYFQEDDKFMSIVVCLVQTLADEGFDVKVDKMCSVEMIEEGPERWAQKHIANSAKVVVLCSPNYIKICQQGKEAVLNRHHSEESRVWFEVQIISHIYSKYKSASKIVCIWCNQGVPDGLPPWMNTTYTWPQDKEKILKRLDTKSHKRSITRETRTSSAESKRSSSLSGICDDDVFIL